MTSEERAEPLRPALVVDLTSADRVAAVDRVVRALVGAGLMTEARAHLG